MGSWLAVANFVGAEAIIGSAIARVGLGLDAKAAAPAHHHQGRYLWLVLARLPETKEKLNMIINFEDYLIFSFPDNRFSRNK